MEPDMGQGGAAAETMRCGRTTLMRLWTETWEKRDLGASFAIAEVCRCQNGRAATRGGEALGFVF